VEIFIIMEKNIYLDVDQSGDEQLLILLVIIWNWQNG